MATSRENAVFRRHSSEISRSLTDKHATCLMLANEMYSRELISAYVRDEVRRNDGAKGVASLLCALEAAVSITPQSLTKILDVLNGCTITMPTAAKIMKALRKSSGSRKRAFSSPNPAEDMFQQEVDSQVDVISKIHILQTKYTELILTLGEALHDGPVQKIRNIVIAAITPGTQATRTCIEQLQTVTSVDDILALIQQHNLCGYLNYRILVAISESHENSLIRNAVQSYQAEFSAFSKACKVSLVVSILAKYSQPNGFPSIVVQLSEAWRSRSLYTLREALAQELDKGEDLQFESVHERSLVLTFSTLPCSWFSVCRGFASTEVTQTLQNLGITILPADDGQKLRDGSPFKEEEEEEEGKVQEVSSPLSVELPFEEPPPQDYICPLCDKLLTEPLQLQCCGDHICQQCKSQSNWSDDVNCPLCQSPDMHTLTDKYFKRQVLNSKVHCYHREAGCGWEGELRDLERHVNPKDHWCDYVFVACEFCCGQEVRRRELKAHKTEHCPKRPATCEYCSYHNTYDVVTEKHSLVCDEFLVECPNQCVVNVSTVALIQIDTSVPEHKVQDIRSFTMKRKELRSHLQNACPLEKVDCDFASAGCPVKLLRKEMQSHLQDAMLEHNILLKRALDSSLKMIARLSRIVQPEVGTALKQCPISSPSLDQYRCNLPPVVFTISDITAMKEGNQAWFSPPFYSFLGGHKLQLKVYPNGHRVGKDTHLSVFAYVMQGENDDDLQWPINAEMEIELLKFGSDEGYHGQVLYLPGDGLCRRVTNGVRTVWAHGIEQFASHSFVFHPSSEYVIDGCLHIRVSKMSTFSTANADRIPFWQVSSPPSQSLCEFTLTQFSRCKALNLRFYSQPFYTRPRGYKMFLRVHANGRRMGFGSHISIGAQLMKGEFDDSLDWPFTNDITYELVNWQGDGSHHRGAISFFFDEDVCSKVVDEIAPCGYLDDKFIPLSALPYNSSTNTQYLQDDCLCFRVTGAASYSTPIPELIPWRDSTLDSRLGFEFTLSEFSKRKQFNNRFESTPFYLPQHKFGVQAVVYANGRPESSGAGSHVSVYASLFAEEHEDSLQIPVSLDVEVQLLDQRGGRNHLKDVIPFRHATPGLVGPRQGFPLFVHHTTLSNSPFLQDDCLRFLMVITLLPM